MNKIKITAFILALTLIFNVFTLSFAESDKFNEKYSTEMSFLKVLELIEEDYDATFVITKGEIVSMVLSVLYPGTDFSKGGEGLDFIDVPENHPFYSQIKAGKDLGIVNGDGNNYFHPDKQICLNEAITVVVNALGYTYHARMMGGYPSGYYMIAKQIGLLKGITLGGGDTVSGGDAVRIIYNALFTNIIEMSVVGGDEIKLKVNSSKNILGERFSVYEIEGIISDNGMVAIDGESTGDRERVVLRKTENGENLIALAGNTGAASYLGHRVKAYIRNNELSGNYEILYITCKDKDDSVTVNAKDIINVTDEYIEYDEDLNTADSVKVKLPGKRPAVIYNGVRIIDKELSELIPKDGFIEFIENTGDNAKDIVIIYSFNYAGGSFDAPARNIVADRIVTEEGEEGISCLFNPAMSVELNDDEYAYSFVLNNNISSLSQLKSGSVVSVAEAPEKINGKTCYMLAVSENNVSGELTSVDNGGELLINGKGYALSSSLTSVKPNLLNGLKLGVETELFLDITGKAAYVKTEASASKDYAYIIKAVSKNQGEPVVLIKLFTKTGELLELPLSDKAVIDGVSVSGKSVQKRVSMINERPSVASVLANSKAAGRPAIVKVNNGMITGIDTDTPNADLSFGELSETYVQQSVIQYTESDAESYDTLKAGFRSPRAVTVRGVSKTVGGKFFITSDTVILAVPEIDTYGLKNLVAYKPYGFANGYLNSAYPANVDMISLYELPNSEENYKVLGASQLYAAFSLDLQGYDIDPDTGVAGLVVVRGRRDAYRTGNISAGNPMAVFIKKTEAYDDVSGKKVTKIHYWENGEKKSAVIDTDECYYPYKALINGCAEGDTPHKVAVKPLRNGDIIRVLQSKGNITHIERVLRIEDTESAYGFFKFSNSVSVPYATSVSGADSTFPFDMPTVGDRDYYTPETSNAVGMSYVKQLKGTTLQALYTREHGDLFSILDVENPLTYTKLYHTVSTDNITVINIPDDGREAEIKKGTLDDIVTLEDVNNDVTKASLVMSKFVSYELDHIIVINGLGNL